MNAKEWSFSSPFAIDDLPADLQAQLSDAVSDVRSDPKDAGAWNNLANALSELDAMILAERCCHRALDLAPDSEVVRYNLLVILVKGRRFEDALEIQPPAHTDAEVAALFDFQHGTCKLELGVPKEAVPYLSRAVSALPDHSGVIVKLHAALSLSGDVAGAARARARFATFFPAVDE